MYTINDLEKYVKENDIGLTESLMQCKEIPQFLKTTDKHIKKIWNSGCWLSEYLIKVGASNEEKENICFSHGQRCVGGDPYEWAVKYLNEFIKENKIQDKPGLELSEKILHNKALSH